jgi:hypothetical protein
MLQFSYVGWDVAQVAADAAIAFFTRLRIARLNGGAQTPENHAKTP